jgi:hypothetical protein
VVDQLLLLALGTVTNFPHNLSQLRKETMTVTLALPPPWELAHSAHLVHDLQRHATSFCHLKGFSA